uniref:Oxidation resistance protein 1 n=1 Tax=Kalanchoe fedtschenkoi TaxID=63787 RepID=A0A7N0V9L2_KALFE
MRENRESRGRRGLISKGKQSVGRMISHAARFTGYGYRSQGQERRSNGDVRSDYEDEWKSRADGVEMKCTTQAEADHVMTTNLPATSEISMLLSERARSALYASLPALVQGRKWVLLYSTWKHGISLSTLYRKSMLWPGLSLLVVGDHKGAVFGGLVEAPLRASSSKRFQGSSSSFVFTNASGHPVIYRPTGANRYYTVCALEYLALGGGGHFALYLDQDLLTGSSGKSETYGNPRLAHTEGFDVKEVELWGFVYASRYDEIVAKSQSEAPGICQW